MSIRIAQILGITGAGWLAGNIASISMVTVPAMEQLHSNDGLSSATIARQWLHIYTRGKSQNPPLALATTVSLGYLAWSCKGTASHHQGLLGSPSKLYGIASLLTISIVPYTILLMSRTNASLASKAAQAMDSKRDAAAGRETDRALTALLSRWNTYNAFRSCLPLLGAITALIAALA